MRRTIAMFAAGALSSAAAAQPFVYTKVTSTTSYVPNAPAGTTWQAWPAFTGLSLEGAGVSFIGSSLSSDGHAATGVYTTSQLGLKLIADRTTPLPGGGTFAGFGYSFVPTARSSEGTVFHGSGTGRSGIFAKFGADIVSIVEQTTPLPGGGAPTGGFQLRGVEGREVLFRGLKQTEKQAALYRESGGTISVAVDTKTPVPGGTGTFADFEGQFAASTLSDGAVTFWGRDSANRSGLYRQDQSGLSVIFDTSSAAPAGLGTFTAFGNFDADGTDLAFEAITSSGLRGLFSRVNGQLSLVAQLGAIGPDGLPIEDFREISISRGSVVWADVDNAKIYTNFGGSISFVARGGMMLDGRRVMRGNFWSEGQDGNALAIAIQFFDDQPGNPDQAIYLVNLPSPGVLGVMAVGGVVAMRRRR